MRLCRRQPRSYGPSHGHQRRALESAALAQSRRGSPRAGRKRPRRPSGAGRLSGTARRTAGSRKSGDDRGRNVSEIGREVSGRGRARLGWWSMQGTRRPAQHEVKWLELREDARGVQRCLALRRGCRGWKEQGHVRGHSLRAVVRVLLSPPMRGGPRIGDRHYECGWRRGPGCLLLRAANVEDDLAAFTAGCYAVERRLHVSERKD
jgi:hypothetical protein